ncbi:hypothetical protein BH23GEM10_BH23GEM10_10900 [soil metagenome]
MRIRIVPILGFIVVFGCAPDPGEAPDTVERTQRQRDSALAESRLPGAGAVGRALDTSDSAAARTARMDTIR